MQVQNVSIAQTCLVFVFALGIAFNNVGFAQEPAKELTQAEIQAKLSELIKTLPSDQALPPVPEDSSSDSSETDDGEYDEKSKLAQPTNLDSNDVVAHLEAAIAELSDRKLSREEGQKLLQLKFELKIAKTIAGQLTKTRLAGGSKSKAKKSTKDSFVITKIEVPPKSSTANITFVSMVGELESTNDLFDYLKAAPDGGFRDYRIVSRHSDSGGAATSLQNTRQEYDLYKEREKQMLAYIAARNKQLAAVKRSKRC